MKKQCFAVGIFFMCSMFITNAFASNDKSNDVFERPAKNIILMVPDGMGLSEVTAARIFKNGPGGEGLSFEAMPVFGYQRTHAANSTVTDSAAAASAWAAGQKFNNGEISCHSLEAECVDTPATILELAKEKGKATGLVATSTISHATPAAFGAHVHSRKCETEIARQFVEDNAVDVLLGGGIGNNSSKEMDNCQQYLGQDINGVISSAQALGYEYVEKEAEMFSAVDAGTTRILGLFTVGGKTPETYRVDGGYYPEDEPTLPEMTRAAIDILEEDKDGFFLMVEGSQVDWENHSNNTNGMLGEMLAFDEAVSVVLDWIRERDERKNNTLVIVVADHDTGGFAINGPYGFLSTSGEVVEGGWTTGNHTAGDTLVWAQGPGSNRLGRALDNTDIFAVMQDVVK